MTEKMRRREIIRRMKSLSNPRVIKGMARFGINSKNAFGASMPDLRKLAKKIGKNHILAQELWDSGVHEARILASIVDKPELTSNRQMEQWVKDFDSWDVCDQVCGNLFDKTSLARKKAIEWSGRKEEFVKRAGFALMACLAVHSKEAKNGDFAKFFPFIKKESIDERNFVKKAVNWALRQIGKRNAALNKSAIKTAKEISMIDSRSAKWIASGALKELESSQVKRRLK